MAVIAALAGSAAAFDADSFRQPGAIYSPGYFWMWNALLERRPLFGQLDDMAANGLKAVCPHPFPKLFRPGACHSEMSPDYLTPGFMKAFAETVDRAKSLGMHVWLYDEGGWPSGSACRQVASSDREGRFCVRYLCRDEKTGELVLKAEPYGGQWGYNPSVIEPGATERFIELTHAAYERVCGEEFGKTIRFAFTDEPTRPSARTGKIPWASDFDAEFLRRKGYAIRPKAALLFAGTNYVDEATAALRVDYEDVMSQLFVERYLGTIRAWCRARGLASGGHLNGEDTPERAVLYSHGSVLRALRSMDVPGVDTIWRQLFPKMDPAAGGIAPFPRYASSAAHQNGGSVVLSETFCIYADSVTPEQMKWTVDSQLVRGVTSFVFGYYALSNAGQWMMLFEPHSGPVQPYWNFEEPFFRYVHRMSGLLAHGRPAAEIAVVFDDRDFWACGEDLEKARVAHYAVASGLDRRNCDFDFIDDDQIAAAEFKDGRIRIGQMSYSTVVLPYSRRLLPAAREKLAAFSKAGGRVLTAEQLDQVPRTLDVSGSGAEDIRVLRRTDGDETLYFLVNEAAAPRSVKIAFAEWGKCVRRADWQSGTFRPVGLSSDVLSWEFPSCGSVAFIVGGDGSCEPSPPRFGAPRRIDGWTARQSAVYAPGRADFEIRKISDSAFAPVRLGDWRPVFGDTFSGKVLYRTTFACARSGRARFDLGTVKGACSVRLNGRGIGTGFFGPHVFDATVVSGENVLEVEVANTLANALSTDAVRDRIARDFPPLSSYDHRQRPFDREFNESGLYGPVTVALQEGRSVTSLSGGGWTFDGRPVSVPHTWNAYDGCDGLGPEARTSAMATGYARRKGTYRRTLPATTPGKRVFVRFGAAASRAEVRVNGKVAGRHAGAFTAFEFEITNLLGEGENVLEVAVDNEIDEQRGEQPLSADFTVYGGLYRDVTLVETDRASFDTTTDGGPGVWVRPDAKTGVVEVETRLRDASPSARVSYEIRERGGRCVASSDRPRLTVPNPRLWSPESPALYTLVARLTDGSSRDEVSVDFGFRTVEIKSDGFYLNGRRRKLRGVNRHQDRERKGWAISAADEAEDVAWIKRMGADAVRTAHYPQSPSLYDLCDREGLLAWVEYPNVDLVSDSAAYAERAATGVREMIAQLRNHPAVFVWSLANEIDPKFMDENGLGAVKPEQVVAPLAQLAKTLDPTRPTALVTCDRARAAVNDAAELLGINLYPGWYRDRADQMSETIAHMLSVNPGRQTVALTEYGAGGCVLQHGDPTVRNLPLTPVHTEEYQAFVHYGNYRDILSDSRLWGSFVWAMFDFGADARREGLRQGINDKGLVTFDHRTPKDAYFFYKANWNPEPALHLVGSRLTETTNAAMTVMAFSNRGSVRLTVNGRDFGERAPDEAKTVFWRDVPLSVGANDVRVTGGGLAAEARWTRTVPAADARTPETARWQAAIDAAAERGGGRVAVPAGVHPVGQINLRSNVELHLERGAVLEGLAGLENYGIVALPCSEGTWSAVVAGFGVTNVAITGEGEINGRGERFSMDFRNVPKGVLTEGMRPRGVVFAGARDIRLSDFTLRDAGCWGVVFKCCDGVIARRVKIDSHAHRNNDGFDIEAKHVLIEDCDVDAGDDGICVKSNTPDFIVEDVVVRRCVVRSHCNGMKLGTASHGTMRNIRFENCTAAAPRRDFPDRTPGFEGRPAYERPGFEKYPNGVGISAICVECVDGGTVEDVAYDGIDASGFQVPIFVRGGTRTHRSCGIPPGDRRILRNIVIRNVRGRAESRVPSSITGVDGCVPDGVTLENIAIACRGEGARELPTDLPGPESAGAYPEATMFRAIRLPAYGLFVDKARNVRLSNVTFALQAGEADFRPSAFRSGTVR